MTFYKYFCRDCSDYFMTEGATPPTVCSVCGGANIQEKMKSIFEKLCVVGGAAGYSGNQTGYMAWHGFFTADSGAQQRVPKCKVKRLSVNVSTNSLNSASTLTVRKNGINQALVVTIPLGGTGQFTATGSIDFADGDLFSIEGALGGLGSQGIYFKGGSAECEVEVR